MLHLVAVVERQADHGLRVAHILDQLVRCLAQGQNVPRQEDPNDLLEIGGQFFFEGGKAHLSTDLGIPFLVEVRDNV